MSVPAIWKLLGLEPTADVKAVRAAYAGKLKLTNPEDDAEGFKRLRAAYESALSQARWRASRVATASGEVVDADDDFDDDDGAHSDEEDRADSNAGQGDASGQSAGAAPAQSQGVPRFFRAGAAAQSPPAPDPQIVAHREFCNALEASLARSAPAAEIEAAYQRVRTSPAMGALNVYTGTEGWLSHLLHRMRPQSDILIDRAIADFGWEKGAAQVRANRAAASVLYLRDRMRQDRAAAELVARFGDRRHEFNAVYRDITRPFAARNWLSRQKSLLRAGLMQRFLNYVAATSPDAEAGFDQDALAWWRDRLSGSKPPYFFVHWLTRVLFLVLVVVCLNVFLPGTGTGTGRDRESGPSVFSSGDDRIDGRRACAALFADINNTTGDGDCGAILVLAPESLLMEQYSGIALLRAHQPSAALDRFNAILTTAPVDAYALYGRGYAMLQISSADHHAGAQLVAEAKTADPSVETYFADHGVAVLIADIPEGVAPAIYPTRDAPAVDHPPHIVANDIQENIEKAKRALGIDTELGIGLVKLSCLARISGKLSNCMIVSEAPANHALGEVALNFALSVQVTPATLSGAPVDSVPIRLPINFAN